MKSFRQYIPENSFIDNFMEYMSENSTPEVFDFWTGLVLLSSLTDKMFVNCLNICTSELSVVLLADNIINVNKCINTVNFLTNKNIIIPINSIDKPIDLLKLLVNNTKNNIKNKLLLSSSNISNIMSAGVAGILDNINNDCVQTVVMKGKVYEYRNVFPVLFCGSSCNWFYNNIVGNSSFDSFVKRTIVVPNNKNKTTRESKITNFSDCVREFYAKIQERRTGELGFKQRFFTASQSNKLQRICGEFATINATKIAMLLAINDGSFEVSKKHISDAIEILIDQQKSLNRFTNTQILQQEEQDIEKVVATIRKSVIDSGNFGINHSELYYKVRAKIDKDTFTKLMTILHEINFVDVFSYRNNSAYIYRANDNTVENRLKINKIIKQLMKKSN